MALKIEYRILLNGLIRILPRRMTVDIPSQTAITHTICKSIINLLPIARYDIVKISRILAKLHRSLMLLVIMVRNRNIAKIQRFQRSPRILIVFPGTK